MVESKVVRGGQKNKTEMEDSCIILRPSHHSRHPEVDISSQVKAIFGINQQVVYVLLLDTLISPLYPEAA